MALKPCSACGKDVAVNARKCPHCGKAYPAPGLLWSVMMLLIAVPLFALAALLIYAMTVGLRSSPSPPSSAIPEAAPGVSSDTACVYTDADHKIWPSVFATDEGNPEGLVRQDELQSLPCNEQHEILTILAGIPENVRAEEFEALYASAVKSNELAKEAKGEGGTAP